MQTKRSIVVDKQLDLQEATELIEISRRLFQEKLAVIKSKSQETKDNKSKKDLETQAENLYNDYRKSLSEIEKFIDEVTNSVIN